jgi:hypothetical protein
VAGLLKSGSLADRTCHDAEGALRKAEADERAAFARLAQLRVPNADGGLRCYVLTGVRFTGEQASRTALP